MKKLLSTTALAVALGFPAMTLAQTTAQTTTAPAADQATLQQPGATEPFLAARGATDLFASELIGQDVYARRTAVDATTAPAAGTAADPATGTAAGTATGTPTGTQPMHADGAHGTHGMTDMHAADLESMDNIGQINEIVLSNDGEVRAIVIGVGGFLGMGEQEVAVSMDQVSFASDPDDRSQVYVVVNTSADRLQESPAYERTAMMDDRTTPAAGAPMTGDGMAADRSGFIAPDMQREGYDRVAATDITADTLLGMTVYDVNDDSVGDVDDLILDDAGAISHVIIDFGGFLGIGSNQVSVGFDELTILRDTGTMGGTDLRIYIDATAEQVQAQPQYQPVN